MWDIPEEETFMTDSCFLQWVIHHPASGWAAIVGWEGELITMGRTTRGLTCWLTCAVEVAVSAAEAITLTTTSWDRPRGGSTRVTRQGLTSNS